MKRLFVFGRPGSGKSTAIAHIERILQRADRIMTYLNDYPILYQMYRDGRDGRIAHTNDDGFDILDFSLFNDALITLKEGIQKSQADVVIIEFARNDYKKTFTLLGKEVFDKSSFLFCEAPIDVCMRRVQERVEAGGHPSRSMERYADYYGTENWDYVTTRFCTDFEVDEKRLDCIWNTYSLSSFLNRVSVSHLWNTL